MKVAIITGAAQGIGRRTSEVLAEAGYALALLDQQTCAATSEAVSALGAEAFEQLGDISDDAFVSAA
ncbi:MAG: SDR family NAD(P)-dependent oxidoreductase, partial [Granulicella sp.]